MLEGRQTVDQSKRAEIYKTALQLIYDQVPVISIAHSTVITPVRNEVMDFKQHPTNSQRFKNVWLK
jgi:ABC-type transport system substrate-binding protein